MSEQKLKIKNNKLNEFYHASVEDLIFDPIQFNTRWKMPSQESIQIMVDSLRTEGQQQPISCYFMNPQDTKPTIIQGFCRSLAFKELNRQERVDGVDETPIAFRLIKDKKEFKDILLAQVAENVIKFNLSPMDKAYGMKKLIDEFNLTQSEVGVRYDVSQPLVSVHLKFLDLNMDIQDQIHTGELPFSQAQLLSQVKKEKIDEVLKEAAEQTKINNETASNNGEKVHGNKGKARIDTKVLKETISKKTGKKFAKSISNFKELLIREDKEEPDVNDSVLNVMNAVYSWFEGEYDDDKFLKKLINNCK